MISTDTLDVIECRLEDEKELHLTDDSSDYVLSVANQHILVKRTLLGREVIKHPKTVRLDDSSVLCQVNDKWIYVMDFEGDKVLAQYRVEENSY